MVAVHGGMMMTMMMMMMMMMMMRVVVVVVVVVVMKRFHSSYAIYMSIENPGIRAGHAMRPTTSMSISEAGT